MKISVVIPVYNEEKYIDQCLSMLNKQIVKADEIIIVDNNCTDKTIRIAKKFNVRIIEEKKQGMIFARNKGFNSAKGDIVARTDADAIPPKNWVKKIKNNFKKYKIDALTGPIVFYDLAIKSTIPYRIGLRFLRMIKKGQILLGPNMAVSKKIWNKVKNQICMNEDEVHEDIDLAIHIHQAGGIIHGDRSLIMETSARRIKNDPLSFFVEYPIRLTKMLIKHKS